MNHTIFIISRINISINAKLTINVIGLFWKLTINVIGLSKKKKYAVWIQT